MLQMNSVSGADTSGAPMVFLSIALIARPGENGPVERYPVTMTLLDAARTFRSVYDESADDRLTVAASVTIEAANADVSIAASLGAASLSAAPPMAAAPVHADPATASPGFGSLGLPGPLVRTLRQAEIVTPFPIQRATIPDALSGRDVLGRGQTGSGKTLAFGLPMLARIAASGRSAPHRPKGLVLVPTRELAMQVNDALTPLAKSVGLFTKTAFGGAPYSTQLYALERGVDVLVATPGRLGDLIERGACSLDSVTITVLDEADQMADMGFLPDVTALLAQTPANAQRLLFSATLDGDVDALVRKFMTDPVTHEIDGAVATVDTMAHHALLIPPREKFDILAAIANRAGRTIMFVQTQMAVDRLVDQLGEVGVRAGSLHGGKTQRVRTRTLAEFKEGRVAVLVATNVAARGIHVDGVDLVVHVDPPKDSKDYLHRAGRTARAGESGTVVTLILPRQRRSTFTMLEKAGVAAVRTEVTVEATALSDVTGARQPSGVPVPPLPEPSVRNHRGDQREAGRTSGAGRFGRPYADRAHGGDRSTRGDRPHRTDRTAGTGRTVGERSGEARTFRDRSYQPERSYHGDRSYQGGRPSGDSTYQGDRAYQAGRPYQGGGQAQRRGQAQRGGQAQGDGPGGRPPQSERVHGDRPHYRERRGSAAPQRSFAERRPRVDRGQRP
jgi:superfamily II DNA/RNA helicase